MIIAGATYADGRITVKYDAADGTRGASWTDPYRLEDIYDTAVANVWDVEKSEDQYVIRELLTVTGSATYFLIENENVQFVNNTGSVGTINFEANCRIYRSRLKTLIAEDLILNFTPYVGLSCDVHDVVVDSFPSVNNRRGVIFRNVQYLNVTNSYITATGSIVDIDNFIAKYSTYGFILQNPFASATRIRAEDCTSGNLTGYGSFKLYSYEARNNTNDIIIYINGAGRFCEYVDPYLDLDKIALLAGGFAGNNRSGQVLLYSTFQLISDIADVDYILRDNYGDIVSQGSFVSEYEEEVIFWNFEGSSDASGTVTSELKDAYAPYNLTITKAGYQDNVIPDIEVRKVPGTNIVTGDQTIIRVNMVREPLQITAIAITDVTRVGLSDGEIEVTAEGGDLTYEYSIDNVNWQVSNTFTGLAAGTYTVYVRDGQTVPFTDSFAVEVQEPTLQPVPDDFDFELIDRETISLELIDRDIIELELKDC